VTGPDGEDGAARAPSRPIFLSYASQDTAAAARLCEALRAAGLEVWFDRSELRGGDAWDQQIRQQIRDCALLIPVISAQTEARPEGYFRREWRLAAERTHDMAEDVPYLVPVTLDALDAQRARVPEAFRALQWTYLPGGSATPEFIARIRQLLAPAPTAPARRASPAHAAAPAGRMRRRWVRIGASVAASLALSGLAYFVHERTSERADRPERPEAAEHAVAGRPDGGPPPHSVAVLPFANLSGDPQQEYFSDGLSEEVLNALARVDRLHVAARTSSFAFRGAHGDLADLARRLNVGTILEGSVRRDARRVRVTAELVNATTGFQLWSHAYDEDVKDTLSVQTAIAAAVARELDVALSGNALETLGVGGTHDPAALDAYLRGTHLMAPAQDVAQWRAAIAEFDAAIARDPRYAAAYALRAIALTDICANEDDEAELARLRPLALASAEKAVALAPDLAEAYAARGFVRNVALLDFGTRADFDKALSLEPGSALVQSRYAAYANFIGDVAAANEADRRASELDPENAAQEWNHVLHLLTARRWDEAEAAIARAERVHPRAEWNLIRADALLGRHDYAGAARLCESSVRGEYQAECLAYAYRGLGRTADADAQLHALQEQAHGHAWVVLAGLYAQRGDTRAAIRELEEAVRHRSPALQTLRTRWEFDPLRQEPGYLAVERALNFPPRP